MLYTMQLDDLKVVYALHEMEVRVLLPGSEIEAARMFEQKVRILSQVQDELGKEIRRISFYRRIYSPSS